MMEESLAYCSGQCQASRYPPATCRCPCMGRNHGVLRYRNPVINVTGQNPYGLPLEDPRSFPSLPLRPGYFLPGDVQVQGKKESPYRPVETRPTSSGHGAIPMVFKKGKARRLLKAITGIRNADDLNEKVLKGLRYQFNAERVEAIVDQAFTIRQSERPEENRPELYELYETGEIDKATELFGSRWVIGRPKIRNSN